MVLGATNAENSLEVVILMTVVVTNKIRGKSPHSVKSYIPKSQMLRDPTCGARTTSKSQQTLPVANPTPFTGYGTGQHCQEATQVFRKAKPRYTPPVWTSTLLQARKSLGILK